MRIECLMPFKEGREAFEKGDVFTVPDAQAAYFIKNGWVKEVGTPDMFPTIAEPATLDVQSIDHIQKAVTHG